MKNWDYSSKNIYFITINTQNRKHSFGEVSEGKMILNKLGDFVSESFRGINKHIEHANTPCFIVMPDHVHAIVEINNPFVRPEPGRFGPLKKKSLSSLVNHFKGRVKKYANKNKIEFEWQDDYDDRFIRDEKSFQRIKRYILNNPKNWKK